MARNAANGIDDDEVTKGGAVVVEVALPGCEPVRIQTRFPWIGAEWAAEENWHKEEVDEW